MADNTDSNQHFQQSQSIAFLQEQGKVSGYELKPNEFHSKNPSELNQVRASQLVTSFEEPQPEQAPDLESGPQKKYIDEKQTAVPLSNFAAANMDDTENNNNQVTFAQNNDNNNNGPNPTDALDAFAPSTNEVEQQNYESFFGDDDNNNNNNNNSNNIITTNNDDIMNMDENEEEKQNEEEPEENKQTFLSVWQEQHREQLAKKGREEREEQEANNERGKKELEDFNEKRRLQIEAARKEAQSRENDLKEDYNAVFKNGTIWQQVAKLVDLKTKSPKTDRFRDLLIQLKNQDSDKQ